MIHPICHPRFSFYNVFIEFLIFEVLSFFTINCRILIIVYRTTHINNFIISYYGNDVFENVDVI